MTKIKLLTTLTIVIGLVALGSGIGIYSAREKQAQLPSRIPGLLWPASKSLQPFSTTDQNGAEFGLESLKGSWSFLFFGYTHCPDICPITMSVLNRVYEKLQDRQQQSDAQMIFVSVDPDRDNTEKLRDYVSYFNEDFYGLTGSPEQILSLAGQIGIAFFNEQASANGDYLVAHTSSLFLINPEGQLIAILSTPHQADEILSRFLEIKAFIQNQAAS